MTDRYLALNAYLLRAGIAPWDAVSGSGDVTFYRFDGRTLTPLEPRDASRRVTADEVQVAVMSRAFGPPAWRLFVDEALGLANLGSQFGISAGVAICCTAIDPMDESPRWVVWCFGTASRSIRKHAIDPRFGLLIALNWIAYDPADLALEGARNRRLRQLQFRTPLPYTQQTGVRAARDVPVEGFRLDRLIDVISGVGGKTSDTTAASQVFGSKSVRFRHTVASVEDLTGLSQELLTEYRSDRYKADFSWIDNYRQVEEPAQIEELRQFLLDRLLGDPDGVDVLIPDDMVETDDDRAIHFIAFPREKGPTKGRITLTSNMLGLLLEGQTDHAALDQVLRFFDASGDLVASAPILDCLAAELEVGQRRVVVYDGDFYQIEGSFLDKINREVDELPMSGLRLPPYEGGDEALWAQRVAESHPDFYVCLDQRLIYLSDGQRFEACDLLDVRGAIIHAKRKGPSSKMTYLFTQAERSCQILSESEEARLRLHDQIAAAASTPAVAIAATDAVAGFARRPAGLSIVIALLGDWKNRTLRALPILTKISLIATVRSLERMGFNASILLVPLRGRPGTA